MTFNLRQSISYKRKQRTSFRKKKCSAPVESAGRTHDLFRIPLPFQPFLSDDNM